VHGWRGSIDPRENAVARGDAVIRGEAVARGKAVPHPLDRASRLRRGGRPVMSFALVAASLLVGALAGCSALGLPSGPAGSAGPSPVPSASASSTDSAAAQPVLVAGGTAKENRQLFDAVSSGVIAADPSAEGRAFVDALVAAGFDKAALEVTDDTTAIGRHADAVQFAVRASDGCIIGERSASGYASLVAPVLGTGRCLVGKTRAIDW
jgi:hypothetical protein